MTRDCQLHVAALRLQHPSEDEGVRRPLIHYALRLTQHSLTHRPSRDDGGQKMAKAGMPVASF